MQTIKLYLTITVTLHPTKNLLNQAILTIKRCRDLLKIIAKVDWQALFQGFK